MSGTTPVSNGRDRGRRAIAIAGVATIALVGTATLNSVAMLPAAFADNDSDGPDITLGSLQDVDLPTTSTTGGWFVELPPQVSTLRGGVVDIDEQFASVADSVGVEYEERHSFDTLWNGVSVDVSDEDAATLAASDDVVAVFPVVLFDSPTPVEANPTMDNAVDMTGVSTVWDIWNLDGSGLSVGIIDTGVDHRHPDLGGNGPGTSIESNERFVAHWDFVGDDYNADPTFPDYNPYPEPDAIPNDGNGHGTHVAGIVGASTDSEDGVNGVAPGVTFGAYKVFGTSGSTHSDIIVAALEMAYEDGMDVVNLSLGAAFASWPEYPTSVAADRLVDAGVTVVAAIGNEAELGLYAGGAPGTARNDISVASFENAQLTAPSITINGETVGYSHASDSPEPPTSGELNLVALGAPNTPEGAAACLAPEGVPELSTDEVILIQRGNGGVAECEAISFYDKALFGQEAGAGAVVLYNNVPGLVNTTVEGDVPITIPVIFIDDVDGQAAVELALDDEQDTTLTWTAETTVVTNPGGGLLSQFSSFGLAADLTLEPDVGAPGGQIYSTLPIDQAGGYGTSSGNSMASPHVAGAAALFIQAAQGETTPQEIRDAFQNTPVPAEFAFIPDTGALDSVNRQGAGLVQVADAIQTAIDDEILVTPGKLSLGESEHGPVTETITVTNNGDDAVTYALAHEDAVSWSEDPAEQGFGLYFPGPHSPDSPAASLLPSTVTGLPGTVTVEPGQTESFDVTIAPSDDLNLAHYGGYITLTSVEDEDTVLSVPYAGYAGDYQAVEVFTSQLGEFLGAPTLPVLTELVECSRLLEDICAWDGGWDFADEYHVYDLSDAYNTPNLLVHLEHPVQNLQIEVFEADEDGGKGDPVSEGESVFSNVDYLSRSGLGGFSPWIWDGTVLDSDDVVVEVADGDYVLEITALKALGVIDNPDHVEIWTSPAFTIDRDGDGNPDPEPEPTEEPTEPTEEPTEPTEEPTDPTDSAESPADDEASLPTTGADQTAVIVASLLLLMAGVGAPIIRRRAILNRS